MKLLFENWRRYLKEDKDIDSVVKVVILNDENKILILKRSDDEMWNLPGGHMKENESEEEGAKREVSEETNLAVENLKPIGEKGKIKYYESKEFSGIIELNEEHTEYVWESNEEIANKDMHQKDKDIITEKYNKLEEFDTNIPGQTLVYGDHNNAGGLNTKPKKFADEENEGS